MKICIVSSCGGHLTEIRALRRAYDAHDHFYVLNDRVPLASDMVGRTSFIRHSERDLIFFVNLWEAFRILRRERPDVILSAGAGPVVAFALVGRLFFGCTVIFIETITRLEAPSLTGRFMRPLAHYLFYQWPSLRRYFPRGIHGGLVI